MSAITYEEAPANGNEHYIELLNDLLCVNHNRIENYRKAIATIGALHKDLQEVFIEMVIQSEGYKRELTKLIEATGHTPKSNYVLTKKIFEVWKEINAYFNSDDRKTILNACEKYEDATQEAYNEALKGVLKENTYIIISKQQYELKISHDQIKLLRDTQ